MNTRILPLTLALFALTVISKAEPPPIIQPIAIVWDATGNAMEQISTRLIAYIEQRAVNYPTEQIKMFELECVRAFKNSDKYADILRKMVDAFTTENLSLPNQLLTYRKLMKEKAERWIFAERSTKDSAKVTISTNHKAAFFEVRSIINEYRTIRLLKERTFTAAPVALNS